MAVVWQSAMVGGAKRGGGRGPRKWPVRHPTRRDGLIAVATLLLPGVIATGLYLRHVDIAGVTVWVAIALGLPVIWLAWATYRESRQPSWTDDLSLAEIADQLAIAVAAQWETEAAARRVNDPWPLSVSWQPADASLTVPWDSLVRLASTGVGWPPPQSSGWASSPDDLAGDGTDLVSVLAKVPTGRLLVLGEPGAGKTMLMVRLVLDLLKNRNGGDPVPVLVPLATWNPGKQELHEWLASQLTVDHPGLIARAPSDAKSTRIQALLNAGLILPILDGLDEIPRSVRGKAVTRIGDALKPGERLVLTCRTAEYGEILELAPSRSAVVRTAAAVALLPLDEAMVSRYLLDDAGGRDAAARWAPVLATLGSDEPVAQVLRTPLMVGLARTIYNPRPGELIGDLPEPIELCGASMTDSKSVERHLFDAFVPAAFREPGPDRHWTADRVEAWLAFIAVRLESDAASPDLAWWKLFATSVPSILFRMFFGLVGALTLGILVGFLVPESGLEAGLAFGIVAAYWNPAEKAWSSRLQFLLRSIAGGLAGGSALGIVIGIYPYIAIAPIIGLNGAGDFAIAHNLQRVISEKLATGLIAGLGAGLAAGAVFGLWFSIVPANRPSDTRTWRFVINSLFGGVAVGLAGVVSFENIYEFATSHTSRLVYAAANPARTRTILIDTIAVGVAIAVGVNVGRLAKTWLPTSPSHRIRLRLKSRCAGIGLSTFIAVWLVSTLSYALFSYTNSLGAGAVTGIVAGLGAALIAGLESTPTDLTSAVFPRSTLATDRRSATVMFLMGALAIESTLAVWIIGIRILSGYFYNGGAVLPSFIAAVAVGLAIALIRTPWLSYQIARSWLALRGKIPWSLLTFLEDAHRRGVLRQVGAVYQFRHIELQHRLAVPASGVGQPDKAEEGL